MLEKTTAWLSEKFVPAANKFASFKVIRAITGGFRFSMPIILVGAVFQILTNLGGLLHFNSSVLNLLSVLNNLTFGLLGLVFAYGIGSSSARAHKVNPSPIGLLSISLFLIFLKPGFADGGFQIQFSMLGGVGIASAILAGVITGEVCSLFMKKGWTIPLKNIPDFIHQWFDPIVPGVIVLALGGVATYLFNFDINVMISNLLAPVVTGGDTLIGLIILSFVNVLGWSLGIHSMATIGFLLPLLFGNLAANAELAAAGLAPTVANGFHITNVGTLFAWTLIGGSGCLLSLNILFLFSKVKSVKALGRASIVPSTFCITEPMLFGAPVVFNPLLALPMVVISSVINPTITYLSMAWGLNAIPFNNTFLPFLPNPVQAFLYNNDWRGVVLVLLLIVLNMVLWYPFFKAYENQAKIQENTTN